MISPGFYTQDNLIQVYLGGTLKHYPRKPYQRVFSSVPYVVQQGDDEYSMAAKWFGPDGQYHWTVIADLSAIRHDPDDYTQGETIQLPTVILNDIINPPLANVNPASTAIAI